MVLNVAIVLMEIVGFCMALSTTGKIAIEYYTEQSNILALVASALFLVFVLTKRKFPKWMVWLKYTATLGLVVTFLVTIFILGPMYEFRYDFLLFHGDLLFFHTFCPIVGVITFVLFDGFGKLSMRDTLLSLLWTVGYAILMIVLNIVGVVSGPYPFLKVTEQSILISLMWITIIFALTFGVSALIRLGKNKVTVSTR